jgi:hypothetical protein
MSKGDLTYEWVVPSRRATDQSKFLKVAEIEFRKLLNCETSSRTQHQTGSVSYGNLAYGMAKYDCAHSRSQTLNELTYLQSRRGCFTVERKNLSITSSLPGSTGRANYCSRIAPEAIVNDE